MEGTMPYPIRSGALASLALAAGLNLLAAGAVSAEAQSGSTTDPQAGPRTVDVVTHGTVQKPPLQLSDAQKQQILAAVGDKNTLDKMPEGFTPQAGAKVPAQEKLPLHPLPPELVQKLPDLKEYEYAKLEHSVLIVDPLSAQVVDVIPQ
jgi:hypothetical protein